MDLLLFIFCLLAISLFSSTDTYIGAIDTPINHQEKPFFSRFHQTTSNRYNKLNDNRDQLLIETNLSPVTSQLLSNKIAPISTPHLSLIEDSSLSELSVHLIAHSHDDAGWLKTFDAYYEKEVHSILRTTISSLLRYPHHRFSQVEISYFSRYFDSLSSSDQEDIRRLIKNGQLEFLLGGWVMHDEADVRFDAAIDQMTLGHQWIQQQFSSSSVPRMGWQIDPFGASAATPLIFSQLCFDASVYSRISQQLKDEMTRERSYEYIWDSYDIDVPYVSTPMLLNHILDSHYGSPVGFEFELSPHESPKITTNNIQLRADVLANELRSRSNKYLTNELLVPYGSDMSFENADIMFDNMDKLLDFFANHTDKYKLKIRYSTIQDYFTSLRSRQLSSNGDVKFPVRRGDLFPYADGEWAWWTGYFTSRPSLKGLIRKAYSILRTGEQIMSLAFIRLSSQSRLFEYQWTDLYSKIEVLRRAHALCQHHDAVTGTAKSWVVLDYENQLKSGISQVQLIISTLLPILVVEGMAGGNNVNSTIQVFHKSTLLLNYQANNENKNKTNNGIVIIVYNSLSYSLLSPVSFSLPSDQYLVQNEGLTYQITKNDFSLPVDDWMDLETELSYSYTTIIDIPPIGWTAIYLIPRDEAGNQATANPPTLTETFSSPLSASFVTSTASLPHKVDMEAFYFTNSIYSLAFSSSTGALLTLLYKNEVIDVTHSLLLYSSYNSYASQRSGAYIFRPVLNDKKEKEAVEISQSNQFTVTRGEVYSEVIQQWEGGHFIRTRIYHYNFTKESTLDSNVKSLVEIEGFIEFEYYISTISPDTELIMRLNTNLHTGLILHTDDSGMRMMSRNNTNRKPIGSTYYPFLSHSYIVDKERELSLSIFASRSHGISSQSDGSIEVMLHRRCSRDDGRGLGEALDDKRTISPIFRLSIDKLNIVDINTGTNKNLLSKEDDTIRGAVKANVYSQGLSFPPTLFFIPVYYSISNILQGTSINHDIRNSDDNEESIIINSTCLFDEIVCPPYHHIIPHYSFLSHSLTHTVDIMTLSLISANGPIMMRLRHVLDSTLYPHIVEINLQSMFYQFEMSSLEERTLSGVWSKEECKTVDWSDKKNNTSITHQNSDIIYKNDPLILQPISIHTFYINVKENYIRTFDIEGKENSNYYRNYRSNINTPSDGDGADNGAVIRTQSSSDNSPFWSTLIGLTFLFLFIWLFIFIGRLVLAQKVYEGYSIVSVHEDIELENISNGAEENWT